MAFNIKNDQADDLLRELTELTGESLTTAVTESLRERLERERRRRARTDGIGAEDPIGVAITRFRDIATSVGADGLTDDELLGYDEHGLPT